MRVGIHAACLLALISCTSVEKPVYPPALVKQGVIVPGQTRSWSDPYRHEGKHCRVHSDIGPGVAPFLADIVDRELDTLQGLFGRACQRKVEVYAYSKMGDFRKVARSRRLTSRTCGIYYRRKDEIHLALTADHTAAPQEVIRHEAAHFFLYSLFDFCVPAKWRKSARCDRLLSMPWWLHEGLACYMESDTVSEHRKSELRRLIGSGRTGDIRAVLGKQQLSRAESRQYAIAWGIVHDLIRNNPGKLKSYMEYCSRGFFEDPSSGFEREFTWNGFLAWGFERRWHKWIAVHSVKFFEKEFLAENETLSDWQRKWETRISGMK